MMNLDANLENNINALLNQVELLDGHFNKDIVSIGNNKFAMDIFSFVIKGKNKDKQIYLTGVYKLGVIELLNHLGVYSKKVYNSDVFVRIVDNVIEEISVKAIKDVLNHYLNQLPSLSVDYDGCFETYSKEAQIETFFKQTHLVINESFLSYLKKDESEILTDTADCAYIPYKNGIIKVTANSVIKLEYAELQDKVVWRNNIISREIRNKEIGGNFSDFIANVSNQEPKRIETLKSAIGYLLHSCHHSSGGQMVLLYDETITDLNNPQGGTGKGLIANSVSNIRKTLKIDGKKFKGDNRFDFQEVDFSTRILWLDDVSKHLDIDRFNSISTDGFNVEKKFKVSYKIPSNQSPKILICSNIILDCSGTTRKRRQFIVELSSFYSSKIRTGIEEPIIQTHGTRFFTDEWDDKEWNCFDWYMIGCLQLYLSKGLLYNPSINVIENRTRQLIGEDFFNWAKEQKFDIAKEYSTKEMFEDYRELFEKGNDKFTQRTFSNKLKAFFNQKEWKIEFFYKPSGSSKVSYFRIRN
jgi:hypothetical protein